MGLFRRLRRMVGLVSFRDRMDELLERNPYEMWHSATQTTKDSSEENSALSSKEDLERFIKSLSKEDLERLMKPLSFEEKMERSRENSVLSFREAEEQKHLAHCEHAAVHLMNH